MFTASRVLAHLGGGAQHFVAPVRSIGPAHLEVVYGDKGYISWKNVQFIRDVSAYPADHRTKGDRGTQITGGPAYRQLLHEYQKGV